MSWIRCSLGVGFVLAAAFPLLADDEKPPVFRSEVAMGRIDAQVMDRDSLSIADLSKNDFVLRSYEHNIPIRSFATRTCRSTS
jgi:hypothetical protein